MNDSKLFFVALCTSLVSPVFSNYAVAADKQTQTLPDQLVWERPFGPSGPERADVSGDKVKGPYNFFLRMPAGFDSGWHTHDDPYTAIVVSGVVANVEQRDPNAARPLPAGAVWTQPAKRNHITRCISETPCVVYVAIRGGATFHPLTADGKPLPATK